MSTYSEKNSFPPENYDYEDHYLLSIFSKKKVQPKLEIIHHPIVSINKMETTSTIRGQLISNIV